MACNYNCTQLTFHEQVTCGDYRKGGVSAFGILDCDHTMSNFTDVAQYNDAIASDLLHIIKGIKGQVPEPAPIENNNPIGCGAETVVDGFDRTATWLDSNVNNQNIVFYNALNVRNEFLMIFNCNDDPDDTGLVTVIEATVNFIAFQVLPESNRERQFWNVTAKWTKLDESTTFTAPAGIFE